MKNIEEACEDLLSTGRWDGQHKSSSTNGEDVETLDNLAKRLQDAEVWLTETLPVLLPDPKLSYEDLLRHHIECAVCYKHSTDEIIKDRDRAGIIKKI